MKTLLLSTLLILALLSCKQQDINDQKLTFLRTSGHDMVNEKGEKVFLKGVGLGNWMLPEGYMWRFGTEGDRPRRIERIVSDLIGKEAADSFWTVYRRDYVTEKDIEQIAALGFNSVRPALNARIFLTEGENPQFIQEGFDLLDSLINRCSKHNLYVILDMHGAPGGQTGQNIDDSEFDEPRLYMEPEKYEPLLTKLWVKLAEKYKDNPTVAGYDLLNEPLPKMTGAADKYKHLIEPLYQRLTTAIRAVDKKHMIILEGADWSNDWSVFSKPFDSNLVYQFHYYCWDSFENVNSIERYITKRKEWNTPVWVGETGEKTAAIHWATIQLLNENNIGWSFWPWKKLDTRKAGNNPYSIVKPEGWDSIVAYSHLKEASYKEWARPVFNQFLNNIKLENCTQNTEMINAMMHRIPCLIEAENFGGKGLGISYTVKDTTKCKNYRRTESVKISYFIEASDSTRSHGQYITLQQDEWTAYNFDALTTMCEQATIKVRALQPNAALEISVNNEEHQEFTLENQDWVVLQIDPIEFDEKGNTLQLNVTSGSVEIDYIDIR